MTGKRVFAASEREKVLFPDPAMPSHEDAAANLPDVPLSGLAQRIASGWSRSH